VYKLYSPDQERFTSSLLSGATGQSCGPDLQGTHCCWLGDPLACLTLCAKTPIRILCCCFPSDCHPGCSTPERRPPVDLRLFASSSELSAVGPNHTTIWLPSSETRIINMLFQCKPQQNDRNPGALAHFCIVSETRGGNAWRRLLYEPFPPWEAQRSEGRVICCRDMENMWSDTTTPSIPTGHYWWLMFTCCFTTDVISYAYAFLKLIPTLSFVIFVF